MRSGSAPATAAPNDPVDNWNLARIYDFTGKLDPADAAYRKALPRQDAGNRKESWCAFARFLDQKKKDRAAA